MEIQDRIPEAQTPHAHATSPIPLRRAFAEILAVYVPSFGLGIVSALIILHDPSAGDGQINGPVAASEEIFQYVMQASVTIFGVAFFCLQRGVTLSQLFGRPKVEQLPAVNPAYGPGYGYGYPYVPGGPPVPGAGYPPPPAGAWPGYPNYLPPRPPTQRSKSWQFSRAYFISMAGVLGFLLSVVIYSAVSHDQTGAPSQGNSPYLILVGLVVALAAGFGEEMLVTGLNVNALEAAGINGKRSWIIYAVAICLRIPFHLYYGWAAFGVIIFTVVNIWVYRRWRLLWPVVLAHATYDFVEYLGSVLPTALAGLLLLGLALGTIVMVIVIICIESSDYRARRTFKQYTAAMEASAQGAWAQPGQNGQPGRPGQSGQYEQSGQYGQASATGQVNLLGQMSHPTQTGVGLGGPGSLIGPAGEAPPQVPPVPAWGQSVGGDPESPA